MHRATTRPRPHTSSSVVALLLVTLLALLAPPAQARPITDGTVVVQDPGGDRVDLLARFPGIDGASQRLGREGWIELAVVQGTLFTTAASHGSGRRIAARPLPGEVSLGLELEPAALDLLDAGLRGRVFPRVTLEHVRAGESPHLVRRIVLRDVQVTSYGSLADGDRPLEQVTLSYARLRVVDTPQLQDGSAGTPRVVDVDFERGRVR